MRLHVLTGSRALLCPGSLPASQSAALIGPGVQVATAFWLSPGVGELHHDFLCEAAGDQRVAVFARSLAENFGTRVAPLIVLPGLLDGSGATGRGDAAPARDTLDVLAEVWSRSAPERLHLHAVALPSAADPDGAWAAGAGIGVAEVEARLAGLRAACAARGVPQERIESTVIAATPDLPGFALLYRNALAGRILARLADRLAGSGLTLEQDPGTAGIVATLEGWGRNGLMPVPALDRPGFESVADRVLTALLAGGGANA